MVKSLIILKFSLILFIFSGCNLLLSFDGEVCGDGKDNDGDYLIDCADSDCAQSDLCKNEICFNGLDDNNNGIIDCDEDVCTNDPFCSSLRECADCNDFECRESDDCSDQCTPVNAFWNTGKSSDGTSNACSGETQCTFDLVYGSDCRKTIYTPYFSDCETLQDCNKGELCEFGKCSTLCSRDNNYCPIVSPYGDPLICATENTKISHLSMGMCGLKRKCNIVNNGGCPDGFNCRLNIASLLTQVSYATIFTFCSPIQEEEAQGTPCNHVDQCSKSLFCPPEMDGTISRVCSQICFINEDCQENETCFYYNVMYDDRRIGFCRGI
jgi:hypothetical protein